jgi:hypothetical protein
MILQAVLHRYIHRFAAGGDDFWLSRALGGKPVSFNRNDTGLRMQATTARRIRCKPKIQPVPSTSV